MTQERLAQLSRERDLQLEHENKRPHRIAVFPMKWEVITGNSACWYIVDKTYSYDHHGDYIDNVEFLDIAAMKVPEALMPEVKDINEGYYSEVM